MSSMVHSITQVLIWLVFIFSQQFAGRFTNSNRIFPLSNSEFGSKIQWWIYSYLKKMFSFIHFTHPYSLKSEKTTLYRGYFHHIFLGNKSNLNSILIPEISNRNNQFSTTFHLKFLSKFYQFYQNSSNLKRQSW